MHFIGYTVQLRRQIFNRRLNEQYVRRTALRRLPMNLLRDLLEGTDVRIDPDVELVRVLTCRLVHKAPVAGPDIDDHSFAVRGDKFFKGVSIELSLGTATN